jgi:hypothetical protein
MGQVESSSSMHRLVINGSAGHKSPIGTGENRHRFSNTPINSYSPSIPNRTTKNNRKTTTLPKFGKESKSELTRILNP